MKWLSVLFLVTHSNLTLGEVFPREPREAMTAGDTEGHYFNNDSPTCGSWAWVGALRAWCNRLKRAWNFGFKR